MVDERVDDLGDLKVVCLAEMMDKQMDLNLVAVLA
jgi:hypothetical protein